MFLFNSKEPCVDIDTEQFTKLSACVPQVAPVVVSPGLEGFQPFGNVASDCEDAAI